jgi:hypothetical protein
MIFEIEHRVTQTFHRNNRHDCLDLIPKTALPSLFIFEQARGGP